MNAHVILLAYDYLMLTPIVSLVLNFILANFPQMEYWVRTPECKAAKSKHIEFIDRVAYSREQVRFRGRCLFRLEFTPICASDE